MRLVQVAKALGMSGQELRKELTKVDFGVKSTDREIPDSLAQGIVRYIARQRGLTVDMSEFEATSDTGSEESEEAATEGTKEKEADVSEKSPSQAPAKSPVPSEPLKVLRKLTLEGVSEQAIQAEQRKLAQEEGPRLSKKEREEREQEEKAMRGKQLEGTTHQEQIKTKAGVVILPGELTVKEFAEKAGVQVPLVVQTLMKNGVLATINQTIDFDTAAIVASELGVAVEREEASVSAEELLAGNLAELVKDEPENLVPRPPVVVVMGHVDHGKTAILDAIRETNVVAGEAGGITQHIGAYQVVHPSSGSGQVHHVTFLDTPGHEAFTAMRARGAQVGDIAVIVVSAEEGVRPTTVEAIDHAKAAEVPIIVAINKIDKPNADPDRVKGELSGLGLQPEEWGGSTPTILCSAVTKKGIPDLLDAVILVGEMAKLTANPGRAAVATVIESRLDPALGPLATLIVNTGTLLQGDTFVCGTSVGKVRVMNDSAGRRIQSIPPSGAVRVAGFDAVPHVGDILQVVSSEREARQLRDAFEEQREQQRKRSFADLVTRLSLGKVRQLKLVLKTDAQGSLDALQEALRKCSTLQVSVKVILCGIGAVTDSDVALAAAGDGMVMCFNVPVASGVRKSAERLGVEVREYDVIYALLEDVTALLLGLVAPEEEEKVLGHLEVKAVFLTKKTEQIVGGMVTDGTIKRLPFRLLRDGQIAGTGRITSLKHVERDIKEAKEGSECGLKVETTVTIAEKDVLEVYSKEFKKKT